MKRTGLGVMAAMLGAAAWLAAAPLTDRWLHVKVVNTAGDKEVVRVNVPLALAEAVLPLIKTEEFKGGKIRIDKVGHEDIDLKALLAAVKNTPDGEFVTVESAKENVRVAKQGGDLLITVRGEKNEKVDIKLPVDIVDQLAVAQDGELDLLALLRALGSHGDLKLVSVEDGTETVGVWIDGRPTID